VRARGDFDSASGKCPPVFIGEYSVEFAGRRFILENVTLQKY
jgi:hypothetical protein